jgi:DNA-binding MurR/RpiR family transcriptional regulator
VHHQSPDDFFGRLAAVQPGLPPKAARLAGYVVENYVQVAFMNTRELATAAGVSLATVVRLPAMLGYTNFDALRASLQDRVNFDLTGVARLNTLPSTSRSPSALLRRIIDADLESLRALAQRFSEPQFERFVSILHNARRVIVLGSRYASPLTLYFGYSLAKIKPDVQAYTQADSTLFDRVRLMEPDDVLVVITVARYPVDLVEIARYAHGLGRRILAITDSPLSPILPLAEVALFAKANALDFVGSLAAHGALINCVVTQLSMRMGEIAVKRLEKIEEAADGAGIYVQTPGHGAAIRRGLFHWDESGLTPVSLHQRGG